MSDSPYEARKRKYQAELERLDRVSARFANARALAFLGSAACLVMGLVGRADGWGYPASGALLCAYVLLAVFHHRVIERENRAKAFVALNEKGLLRAVGKWHAFPTKGERFGNPNHVYSPDLDLFGQGSLFQLLDDTGTAAGEERLASFLTTPANPEEVRQRQGAVKELSPLLDLRQAVRVEATLAAAAKADFKGFIAWAEGGPYLQGLGFLRVVGVIWPIVTWALIFLDSEDLVPQGMGWVGPAVALALTAATKKKLNAFFAPLVEGELKFSRFEKVFETLETHAFSHPRLALFSNQERPSVPLSSFGRLFGFADLRSSGQFHSVVQVLTLWDFHFLFLVEGWRRRHGQRVRAWFDALSEFEALSSLAQLSHDRPHYTFPELSDGDARFVATGLGHPLLEAPVLNDVAFEGPGRAWVVTGSNMSGKTTLLRAIGANTVLAQAGAPVCCATLSLSPLWPLTSMRVKDSLEQGVSYFYAEVARLKKLLDGAEANPSHGLFLLDEILLGTNAKERQLASKRVLELFLSHGAIGAVSTHDLTLAELEATSGGRVLNVHFSDQVDGQKMSFDYRLKPGVVDTTNALRVMKLVGIPV